MSRRFVGADSQFLKQEPPPVTAIMGTTLAMWVNVSAFTDLPRIVWLQRDMGYADFVTVAAYSSPNRLRVMTCHGSVSDSIYSSSLDTDTWYHVCVVFTSTSDVKLYVDGVEDGRSTTAKAATDLTKLVVGRRENPNVNYYSGDMAELAVWDTPLDVRDVSALAARTAPSGVRPDNLALYVPMLDGYASEVGDQLTNYGTTNARHIPVAYPHPMPVSAKSNAWPTTWYHIGGNNADCVLLLTFDRLAEGTTFINRATGSGDCTIHHHGNVGPSTDVVKHGVASLDCDGAGRYLEVEPSVDYAFGGRDWTVDTWALARRGDRGSLWAWYADADNHLAIEVVRSSGDRVQLRCRYRVDGVDVFVLDHPTGAMIDACSEWFHLAVVRSGAIVTMYVNGDSYAATALEGGMFPTQVDLSGRPLYVGRGLRVGQSGLTTWDGYLDQFRVTWGASWVGDFVPPVNAYSAPGAVHGNALCTVYGAAAMQGDGTCGVGIHPCTMHGDGVCAVFGAGATHGDGACAVLAEAASGGDGACGVGIGQCAMHGDGACRVLAAREAGGDGASAVLGGPYVTHGDGVCRVLLQRETGGDGLCRVMEQHPSGGDGLCSVSHVGLSRYEIYTAIGAEPDLTGTPAKVVGALPTKLSLTGAGIHHIVVVRRNKFGLASVAPTQRIELDADGSRLVLRPTVPVYDIAPGPDCTAIVTAAYFYAADAGRAADCWAVWSSTDGNPPDLEDPPTLIEMNRKDGVAKLAHSVGPLGEPGTVIAVVRTHRSVDGRQSDNSTSVGCPVKSAGPPAVTLKQGVTQ